MGHFNNNPIGIFDSGVGGLSVWKEIVQLLPYESVYYYADSAHCPYGTKKLEDIIERADQIVQFLLSKKVKTIVVACNTATAAAIDYLRSNYSIPFIGMEPAVKPAAISSVTGNICVLATENTFKGRLFNETSKKYASNKNLFIQVGYGLVDIVERGMCESPEALELLHIYIDPMLEKNVDRIVLGCTHYPFLENQIKNIVKDKAYIINPALPVAKQTMSILSQYNLLSDNSTPKYQFFTTGNTNTLKLILENMGRSNEKVIQVQSFIP